MAVAASTARSPSAACAFRHSQSTENSSRRHTVARSDLEIRRAQSATPVERLEVKVRDALSRRSVVVAARAFSTRGSECERPSLERRLRCISSALRDGESLGDGV